MRVNTGKDSPETLQHHLVLDFAANIYYIEILLNDNGLGIFLEEWLMVTFNVGDVVQIKSSGPAMTITEHDSGKNRYFCNWFSGKNLITSVFPGDALELFKGEKAEVV